MHLLARRSVRSWSAFYSACLGPCWDRPGLQVLLFVVDMLHCPKHVRNVFVDCKVVIPNAQKVGVVPGQRGNG